MAETMTAALRAGRKGPSHVALIPDGNRRWSRSHGFSIMSSYKSGIEKFVSVSMWAKAMGVKTLTVWALSTENIKNRSRLELHTLYGLYSKAARDPKILALLLKSDAKIKIIGNLTLLPGALRKDLLALQAKTIACKEITINLLMGYGGRDDILHAARHAVGSEKEFGKRIRTSSIPEVDLVIRTSGERRLSGLLPWQTDYSELYFSKKYWPDFERSDLKRAIDSYSARERRFGK